MPNFVPKHPVYQSFQQSIKRNESSQNRSPCKNHESTVLPHSWLRFCDEGVRKQWNRNNTGWSKRYVTKSRPRIWKLAPHIFWKKGIRIYHQKPQDLAPNRRAPNRPRGFADKIETSSLITTCQDEMIEFHCHKYKMSSGQFPCEYHEIWRLMPCPLLHWFLDITLMRHIFSAKCGIKSPELTDQNATNDWSA